MRLGFDNYGRLPTVYTANVHERRLLLLTSLFQYAGVLDIDVVNETVVSGEEIFDLPVLRIRCFIIGVRECA